MVFTNDYYKHEYELELIANAQSGCKEAFDALFKKHQQYIYNLLFQMTNDPVQAEDLAQETFIRVYEKLSTFRAESSLRTWVTRIAINIFHQARRKRPPHRSMKLEEIRIPSTDGNPERIVIKREMQWCIAHVLQYHLPRQLREVLVLRDLQGFSYNEISEILSISLSLVKTRIHRARKAFRDHFIRYRCMGMVEEYLCICDEVELI